MTARCCLRAPIPELFEVAQDLDAAVSAHLRGARDLAQELLLRANSPAARDWIESAWGPGSRPKVQRLTVGRVDRVRVRMPTSSEQQRLHQRDGFACRYCGLPVIRAEVRRQLATLFPSAVPWGRSNASQHAGFQSLWAQYDHVVPHWNGGANDLENLVVSCAACNYGKADFLLEELGLEDPRLRAPVRSAWDGLERLLSREHSD